MKKATIMENVKTKLNANKRRAVYINFEEYSGSSTAFINEINQGLYGSNLRASLCVEQIKVVLSTKA
jgi:hypothetical protein